MKLEQIDSNFKLQSGIVEEDIIWYSARQAPFEICGVIYDEGEQRFLRLPQRIAEEISAGVTELNRHTSGGRIRFCTDSAYIAIHAVMDACSPMPHMPRTGQSGFDLYRQLNGKETYFTSFIPPVNLKDGYTSGIRTYGEETDYTINFPLYDRVQEVYIGIKEGAKLEAAAPYRHEVPVIFYGNSITQGGCASRPGNSYPGFLSRRLSMDFVNLGFSGAGKGEAAMAEYISGIRKSILVMDYDSNADTVAELQATHYPFYKIVRKNNPGLPIVMISHPSSLHGVHYTMRAPKEWGTFEKRYSVIRETWQRAKAEGDDQVYFIDGSEILAGEEWDACSVDGTHLNDFGFLRFAQYLEKILEPLLLKL